jgi:hypothetical protein
MEATVSSATHLGTEIAGSIYDRIEIHKRPLDPLERISEIWFGLIMVLTFTCSFSVEQAGRQEVRTMLIAAIGCNLAWGVIDAFLYALNCFLERGRSIQAVRALRSAPDAETARKIIGDAIPRLLATLLSDSEYTALRNKVNELPAPPSHPRIHRSDMSGALAVFFAVFLSTFPVVIPFLLFRDVMHAVRISNAVAVAALFLTGFAFGRYAGYRPWRMGLGMAIVASLLVALTIRLGG